MADAKPSRPIPSRKIVDGVVVEDQTQTAEVVSDVETEEDFIPDHLVERTPVGKYRPLRVGQYNARGAKVLYVARMPSGAIREDFE